MNVGLLNLTIDFNYGGNLQRFALVSILQELGHDVVYLELHRPYSGSNMDRLYKRLKDLIKDFLVYNSNKAKEKWPVRRFQLEKIPHTKPIFGKKNLIKYRNKFDAYVVGSDQVWRKSIAIFYGVNTYFFDFLENVDVKRVAYGVSLGSERNEFCYDDLQTLSPLYQKFDAVSVREMSSLKLFDELGWTFPPAKLVLDPTFLLQRDEYEALIDCQKTFPIQGDIFCYILDKTEEKQNVINAFEQKLHASSFWLSLNDGAVSVEQWLRSFKDSKFVVTDSFHGLVFSIIFNKPYYLIKNASRGNARFDSLFDLLGISCDGSSLDWERINSQIASLRKESIEFLRKSLV